MKYFKLDKDKREIIIDKYKKYNVNVDILNLIIDLKCENDRLNNIINELENIRKETIEYIKDWQSFPHTKCTTHNELKNLLNILSKGSDK